MMSQKTLIERTDAKMSLPIDISPFFFTINRHKFVSEYIQLNNTIVYQQITILTHPHEIKVLRRDYIPVRMGSIQFDSEYFIDYLC